MDAWVVRFTNDRVSNGSDLSGLCVLVSLNTDRFTRTLASTSICRCALAADRKTPAMAQSPIAVDGLETFQIALEFAAEIPLNEETAGSDRLNQRIELLGRQVFCLQIRVQMRLLYDAKRRCRPEAIYVRQGCGQPLVAGDFDSK